MRTVEDTSGRRYLLVKESGESSRVRDPASGEERYLPNDDLSPVDGASPLETAARSVPRTARKFVTAARDERALGLLVELDDRGPLSVRELLSAYDLCESDLHGTLAEFVAAGLIEETEVAAERGYAVTESASDVLDRLREDGCTSDPDSAADGGGEDR